jgi:hypothetical protein
MAKKVYRQYYRMTAARRASIRKAQIASAKKRKRQRRVAVGGGIIAVTMAAAGGNRYGKAKKARRASLNVVQTTMSKARVDTPVSAIKYSSSKEIDIIRNTVDSERINNPDRPIDFSSVGKGQARGTITRLEGTGRRKRVRGEANTFSRGKRIIAVYSDGSTEPVGARARSREKEKINYSSAKRTRRYNDAKGRPKPPRWLLGSPEVMRKRNARLKQERIDASLRRKRRGTR